MICGALNGRVDVESANISPKYRKKATGPTWKRIVGKPRSVLHDVPIFSITSSKRSNDAIMVDTDEWATDGKRVRSNTVKSNSDGIVLAEVATQPRHAP